MKVYLGIPFCERMWYTVRARQFNKSSRLYGTNTLAKSVFPLISYTLKPREWELSRKQ